MKIEFIWDQSKAEINKRKHRISFEEASTVFYDEKALLVVDSIHSIGEERFILLGMSSDSQLLIVVHLYWEAEEVIKLISARLATRAETNQYYAR